MEKYSIILTSLEKKIPPKNSVIRNSHPSGRITIPLIASQRAIHRRETPRAVNSRGKNECRDEKKRGGDGEKKKSGLGSRWAGV